MKNPNFPFFHLPAVFPSFITTPSVIEKDDGYSYIVGCQYEISKGPQLDLAKFAYLIINEKQRIKLNGVSIKLSNSTFQLPENIFVAQGTYRCLIKARNINNGSIYSELSAYIPMPGMMIY